MSRRSVGSLLRKFQTYQLTRLARLEGALATDLLSHGLQGRDDDSGALSAYLLGGGVR